mmetsp:Transcript_84493/g.244260  ORF Transcript_84493/g.244260 Transcript_84493/m.244260 type:complete len:208 (+) Transcript_84493:196-819(+)
MRLPRALALRAVLRPQVAVAAPRAPAGGRQGSARPRRREPSRVPGPEDLGEGQMPADRFAALPHVHGEGAPAALVAGVVLGGRGQEVGAGRPRGVLAGGGERLEGCHARGRPRLLPSVRLAARGVGGVASGALPPQPERRRASHDDGHGLRPLRRHGAGGGVPEGPPLRDIRVLGGSGGAGGGGEGQGRQGRGRGGPRHGGLRAVAA